MAGQEVKLVPKKEEVKIMDGKEEVKKSLIGVRPSITIEEFLQNWRITCPSHVSGEFPVPEHFIHLEEDMVKNLTFLNPLLEKILIKALGEEKQIRLYMRRYPCRFPKETYFPVDSLEELWKMYELSGSCASDTEIKRLTPETLEALTSNKKFLETVLPKSATPFDHAHLAEVLRIENFFAKIHASRSSSSSLASTTLTATRAITSSATTIEEFVQLWDLPKCVLDMLRMNGFDYKSIVQGLCTEEVINNPLFPRHVQALLKRAIKLEIQLAKYWKNYPLRFPHGVFIPLGSLEELWAAYQLETTMLQEIKDVGISTLRQLLLAHSAKFLTELVPNLAKLSGWKTMCALDVECFFLDVFY